MPLSREAKMKSFSPNLVGGSSGGFDGSPTRGPLFKESEHIRVAAILRHHPTSAVMSTCSVVVAEAVTDVSECQIRPGFGIVFGCKFVVTSDRSKIARLLGDDSRVPCESRNGLTFSDRVPQRTVQKAKGCREFPFGHELKSFLDGLWYGFHRT